MGGFLAALGGAGQQAAQYGAQQRELHHQTKMELARQLIELTKTFPPDSAEFQMGVAHLNDVLGSQSGKDNTSLMQKVHDWLYPHPANVKGMQQLYQMEPPKVAAPGPAKPGSVPGTKQLEPGSDPLHSQQGGFLQAVLGRQAGQGGIGKAAQQGGGDTGSGMMQALSSGGTGGFGGPRPGLDAAQPASSPIQPAQEAAGPPPQQPAAPQQIQPVQAPSSSPAPAAPINSSWLRQVHTDQVNQPFRQSQAKLGEEEALRQMDLGERAKALGAMGGILPNLPPMQQAQYRAWAHSRSAPLPSMPAAMIRPVNTPGQIPTSAINPDELIDIQGNPIDPASSPFMRSHQNLMTGQVYYSPSVGPVQTVAGDNGQMQNVAKLPGAVAGAPMSTLTPRLITLPDGTKAFQSPAGAKAGAGATASGGVDPSMLTTSSTVSTPGSLPTTTTKSKVGMKGGGTGSKSGAAPYVPPIDSKVAGAKETPRPEIAGWIDDIMAGKTTIDKVPQKERNAIQQYMNRNKMEKPEVLSAAGQKNLFTIDPVITQIDGLTKQLEGLRGKNLMLDYQKYKNGFETPYDSLFTGIAFERLRSGSAALQGLNSRALPIISEGLKHTPTFDRLHGFNPDSVNVMLDKLKTARGILQEERDTVTKDQRKSGVLGSSSIEPVGGGVTEIERGPDGKLRIKR